MPSSIAQQLVDDIKGKLNASEFTSQVVEPVNDEAIRLTKRNTRDGKGLGDDEFQEYAPSTAKKKGRTAPVTFRETGTTFANIYGEATGNKGEISFNHNADVMWFHQKGEGRNPKREIFPEEYSPTKTMEELKDFTAELIRRYLQDEA